MADILVTGAGGFIGAHLVPWLAQHTPPHRVYAVVRPGGRRPPAGPGVVVVPWDVTQPCSHLPNHVDAIIHLAQGHAPFPERAADLFAVNVGSTQRLLDYARAADARTFLLASTGSVYGAGPKPWTEADHAQPDSYYGATKLAAEWLVRAYAFCLSPIIYRLFVPYGPGQTNRLVPGLIERVRTGRPVTLRGGGRPAFNPIYVADVLPLIERALALEGSHVVNIGGDEALSIRDMADQIGHALGRRPVYEQAEGAPPGDTVGDGRLMHALLRPSPLTSFADGVAAMIGSASPRHPQVPSGGRIP